MSKVDSDLFRTIACSIYEKNGRDLEKTKLHLRARLRSDVKLLDAVIERELRGIVGIDHDRADSQREAVNPEADGSQFKVDNQRPLAAVSPIQNESGDAPVGGGQPRHDNLPMNAAAPTPNSSQAQRANQRVAAAVPVGSGGGPPLRDNQKILVAAASVHVKAHIQPKAKVQEFWRHPPRSEAEKEASRTAMLVGSSVWRQFGMEKLRYREIDAFIEEMIETGAVWIKQGTSNIQRGAFAWLVRQHGKPSDDSTLLSDIITENEAARLAALAVRRAPEIADEIVKAVASNMRDRIKLVAAE